MQHYSAYVGANVYKVTGLLKNILPLPKIACGVKLNAVEFRRKEMEPLIPFLIKEMPSFSTRSIILFDILSQLFAFISLQFFILL